MKECAIQLEELETIVDVEIITYLDAIITFSSYLREILDAPIFDANIDVDFKSTVLSFLHKSDEFFKGNLDSKDLLIERVKAWNAHDAEADFLKKSMLRAVVTCLYESNTEGEDSFEMIDLFELFFSILEDMDSIFCRDFGRLCRQKWTV